MTTKRSFRAANGKLYTRQLFWEEWITLMESERVGEPIFTLHKNKPGLINLGQEYVRLRDPSGYKLATKHLEGYTHWQALQKCQWFQAAKKLWDEELDAVLASEAMEKIRELLENGLPAQQLAAAKFLAGKEYRKDKTTTKGRPKQHEIDMAAKEEAALLRAAEEDLKRIRLVK